MTKNEDVYGTVREAVAAHRIPCQVDDGQECIRAKQQRDELLARLKDCREYIEEHEQWCYQCELSKAACSRRRVAQDLYRLAQEAIAKAEGE